jgi:hypothetical protein
MRRLQSFVPVLLAGLLLLTATAFGQQKLAQTGMKFLNVSLDARATAMGEAFTAVEGSASSLFFNASGMARVNGLGNVALGQVQWIADIKHNYAAACVSPSGGEFGVLGIMIQSVDYGDLEGTVLDFTTTKGYQDVGTFSPKATMLGLGYARALSDKFAVGGVIKWVHQNLGDGAIELGATSTDDLIKTNIAEVFAFDFGMIYKTGFKSLQFGVVIKNFSKEARFIDEGFQLPLTFKIGASMNVIDLTDFDKETHQFLLSIEAEHPRDYTERVRVGGEYTFMKMLALRAGFVSHADEQKFSYGVGLQKDLGPLGVGVDYAYTPFGVFGKVHTVAMRLWF